MDPGHNMNNIFISNVNNNLYLSFNNYLNNCNKMSIYHTNELLLHIACLNLFLFFNFVFYIYFVSRIARVPYFVVRVTSRCPFEISSG